MSDPTPTRQETVEAAIAAAKEKYGPENWNQMYAVYLEEACISLAMLVDGGATTEA